MNDTQAVNPYLPSYEYIPDAEPRVFNGRVYIYGSHDKFNGISFCLNDYVCYSASVNNLADWRYEGVIFRKKQDPSKNIGFLNALFAPDVVLGADGKYYLYYFIGFKGSISVAVCDTPAGKYRYLGRVRYADGTALGKKNEPLQFDPGVFVDDDGRVFLYSGFAPTHFPSILFGGKKVTNKGAMVFELMPDMLTIKGESFKTICAVKKNEEGSDFCGHAFFEASSMRKFNGKYYFIYSSYNGHELCYAFSNKPDEGFAYGGTLVSIADAGLCKSAVNYTGNTHGSIACINGEYYVFYHRQTNRHQFSRQACAEKLVLKDGRFLQSEVTSCGLNNAPLLSCGVYPAYIACNLFSKQGTYFYGAFKRRKSVHPYFTQSGKDRENNPNQYIANFCDGATAGFKYFALSSPKALAIRLKGRGKGVVTVALSENKTNVIAQIPVKSTRKSAEFVADLLPTHGTHALYFTYNGKGAPDFVSFRFIEWV